MQISVYLDIDQDFVKVEELCLNPYLVGLLLEVLSPCQKKVRISETR